MVFFLKEAVHQRAFCSYIVFFLQRKILYNHFFFSSQNSIWWNIIWTHDSERPDLFVFPGPSSGENPRSACRLVGRTCLLNINQRVALTGFSFLILQYRSTAIKVYFFKWFYLKSQFILVFLISVPCLSLVHPFPFIFFSLTFQTFKSQKQKIKTSLLNKSQNEFFVTRTSICALKQKEEKNKSEWTKATSLKQKNSLLKDLFFSPFRR